MAESTTPLDGTEPASPQAALAQQQRPRSHSNRSDSSLSGTMDFYNVRRQRSLERHHSGRTSPAPRPTSPPTTPRAPSAGAASSSTSPRLSSAHSASILPSASFFNPKRPSRNSALLGGLTSPPLGPSATAAGSPALSVDSSNRSSWRYSTGPGGAISGGDTNEPQSVLGLQQHHGQRRGNGPLITRVSAASDFAATQPSSVVSTPPTASVGRMGGTGTDRHSLRRMSAEMSEEDVEQDLAAGGLSAARLARLAKRASLEAVDGPSSWAYSRPPSEHDMAPSISRSSFDHPGSSVGHANPAPESSTVVPQPSREGLLNPSNDPHGSPQSTRRYANESNGNGGAGAIKRALTRNGTSANGNSPHTDDETNSHWGGNTGVQLGSHGDPSTSLPSPTTRLPPPAQATTITLPTLPLLDSNGRKVRNYKLHPGSNRFFFSGRALSSSDNPLPFLICFALSIILPVLFFAFSGPFLWSHLGGGGKASIFVFVWMCAVMWTNMCKTAWRDPGIIPRDLDRTPERKWIDDLGGEGVGGWKAEPRYMRIKQGVVASKWCETCETYRPPRTSHCRLCDNCVEHTDHHCTFLNNCIGRRNYTSFFAFLVSSLLCSIYAIAFSSYHISTRHTESPSDWLSKWDVIGSFIVCVLTFALFVPIAGLWLYHLRLLWSNRTTIEMLRPKGSRSGAVDPASGEAVGNLFSLGSPFSNMVSLLCRPMEMPSWIAPSEWAVKDAREENGKEGEGGRGKEV